jgi:DNA primase
MSENSETPFPDGRVRAEPGELTQDSDWVGSVRPSPRRRTRPSRYDKDAVDLAALATDLMGLPTGRQGDTGKLWWLCPFHDDSNPSFNVDPEANRWRCYGCGAHGDAADLVEAVQGCDFKAAVDFLSGKAVRTGRSIARKAPARPKERSSDWSQQGAVRLLHFARRRLWSPDGASELRYLRGRGLTDETIKSFALGSSPPIDSSYGPRGVLIPWAENKRITLLKIRQPDGRTPKYRELFRDGPSLYPSPCSIRPGKPLVVVEGELDALLLGQELGEMAGVVTLGSAANRPSVNLLAMVNVASALFIATDADDAGELAAAVWLQSSDRAERIRSPRGKDWTEANAANVDLREFWRETIEG